MPVTRVPVKNLRFVRTRRRRSRKKIKSTRFKSGPRRSLTYTNNVGLGNTKRVKMSYYETIGLTSTSGIVAKHTFNLASIFDPDVTGVGHQPFGHDEYAVLYKEYYVTGAKISVKWSNIATNNIGHKVFVTMDKDNVIDGNLDTRMEQTKGSGTKTLLPNSNNTQVTQAFYSPRKFHDIKNTSDDHQLKALFGANPVKPAYAVIGLQPVDQVSSSGAIIYGEVFITYDVVLFNPIPFGGS